LASIEFFHWLRGMGASGRSRKSFVMLV
jgi:hypothetical protein